MKQPGSGKKKQLRCPRCNHPATPGNAFCESCGARVMPPPSCSLCGTLLEPGSRFCPSCGTMVGSSKDLAAEAPAPAEPEAAAVQKAKPSRAKKPAPPPEEEPEKAPDPLMMAEETGPSEPAPVVPSAPAVPAPPVPEKKEKVPAVRPAPVTIPPPKAVRSTPLSAITRNKVLMIVGAVIILAGIALVLTGTLHIPGFKSQPATAQIIVPPPTEEPVPVTTAEPAVTALPETILAAPTDTPSLIPEPTVVPPDNYIVYFETERDPISKMVTVLFKGGKGQRAVRDVFIRLTRSDGKVLEGTFKPIQVDSGTSFQGTEKEDRLEVIVRYVTGEEYRVIDKVFEYKIRN